MRINFKIISLTMSFAPFVIMPSSSQIPNNVSSKYDLSLVLKVLKWIIYLSLYLTSVLIIMCGRNYFFPFRQQETGQPLDPIRLLDNTIIRPPCPLGPSIITGNPTSFETSDFIVRNQDLLVAFVRNLGANLGKGLDHYSLYFQGTSLLGFLHTIFGIKSKGKSEEELLMKQALGEILRNMASTICGPNSVFGLKIMGPLDVLNKLSLEALATHLIGNPFLTHRDYRKQFHITFGNEGNSCLDISNGTIKPFPSNVVLKLDEETWHNTAKNCSGLRFILLMVNSTLEMMNNTLSGEKKNDDWMRMYAEYLVIALVVVLVILVAPDIYSYIHAKSKHEMLRRIRARPKVKMV